MFDIPRLSASGLVRHVDFHETLGSTSDRALELAARDDLPLPLLVLAARQTGGRGRGTNRWWAAEGALTFSLVLEASASSLSPRTWPQVSLVAGLAVCEALAELASRGEFRVKWPNDVYLNGGKVCGVLCESAPGWPDRLVIGIGINVNNSVREAGNRGSEVGGRRSEVGQTIPPEVQNLARALVDVDGLPRDLTAVLLAVLDRLDERWSQLAAGEFPVLAHAYRERCLLTGKTLAVQSASQTHLGVCRGIDDYGALVLVTENGAERLISGTILSWE
jgi:BirA family biotin operon repressor/biotin-[acetyl-CoA-carboxylase] ligase